MEPTCGSHFLFVAQRLLLIYRQTGLFVPLCDLGTPDLKLCRVVSATAIQVSLHLTT
jgi:hypothetical protein